MKEKKKKAVSRVVENRDGTNRRGIEGRGGEKEVTRKRELKP